MKKGLWELDEEEFEFEKYEGYKLTHMILNCICDFINLGSSIEAIAIFC